MTIIGRVLLPICLNTQFKNNDVEGAGTESFILGQYRIMKVLADESIRWLDFFLSLSLVYFVSFLFHHVKVNGILFGLPRDASPRGKSAKCTPGVGKIANFGFNRGGGRKLVWCQSWLRLLQIAISQERCFDSDFYWKTLWYICQNCMDLIMGFEKKKITRLLALFLCMFLDNIRQEIIERTARAIITRGM